MHVVMTIPIYNLYPGIEPFNKNWLKVSDFHEIYYEECGNEDGEPVIFLHGGPGSGCNPTQRRFFDPAFYRIILLDQRGCGRSTPQGEIKDNTTDDLINDIEVLRQHLNINKWHVFGGSWGSTLALVYALKHTPKVNSLILRGIFLSRPAELHWFLSDVKLFYPEPWEKLLTFLPEDKRQNLIGTYEKLVFSDDRTLSIPAAIAWNAFESSIMTLVPRVDTNTGANQVKAANQDKPNGEVELARARVQIHYIQNHCFIGHRDLLAEAKQALADIPTIIIQGRYDMVCPPQTAWELAQAMPHAEFIVVPDAGHSAMEPGICAALVAATEKFKACKKTYQ
jgi:proline iminopeptidase